MKARKVLQHGELLREVERQLATRFPPSKSGIKKRIESLIEREYLQRDASNARSYSYLP
jgi:cullin 3|tara:strand:+ start:325 stop:501 length:177 start_codon:yes stop_codon:yes gene_type:complete